MGFGSALKMVPILVDILVQGPLHAAIHAATAWPLVGGWLAHNSVTHIDGDKGMAGSPHCPESPLVW